MNLFQKNLTLEGITMSFIDDINKKFTDSHETKTIVHTEEELAKAIDRGTDVIVIEGKIKNAVIRIKAVNKVAWAVVLAALIIVIVGILTGVATAGISTAASVSALAPAAAALGGMDVATTAVNTAVAAGGANVLNKIRSYKIIEKNNERIILKK